MWFDALHPGRAVLRGRSFHDHEDLTVCGDCQVFVIMGAGRRRGTGSTPGCGTAGDQSWQTTQMARGCPPVATRRKLTLFSYAYQKKADIHDKHFWLLGGLLRPRAGTVAEAITGGTGSGA